MRARILMARRVGRNQRSTCPTLTPVTLPAVRFPEDVGDCCATAEFHAFVPGAQLQCAERCPTRCGAGRGQRQARIGHSRGRTSGYRRSVLGSAEVVLLPIKSVLVRNSNVATVSSANRRTSSRSLNLAARGRAGSSL